jgi:enhancing lycopene biosynthesis protein 2
MIQKVAVILSGCGVYDGAEIHESVFSMYFLAKKGIEYSLFAPDTMQAHVINHLNGTELRQERNVLMESARIARGKIAGLNQLKVNDFDALYFPGGFGVAKNMTSYAFDGDDMSVDWQVEDVIKAFFKAQKPIVALCISPVMIAKVLGNVTVTIGNDGATARSVKKFGAQHVNTEINEVFVDEKNRIITAPCYMHDASVLEVAANIEQAVDALIRF